MKVVFENLNIDSGTLAPIPVESLCVRLADHKNQIIELKNVLSFPGLINSHDHLDFDLFPCFGNGPYKDYKEWSADIHRNNKSEIESILKIPIRQRIQWGILKNLIAGVTTIVHHGEHHKIIQASNYPIHLDYQYLHALDTEPCWKIKLLKPSKKDIMIHIGEGLTPEFEGEITELLRWNLMKRDLVGIHAISMNEEQSKHFKGIVWCPDSNIRLYGQTAKIDLLKRCTEILFGTDSTLTSSSNIWDHLRLARELKLLSNEEIFESLTRTPERVFHNFKNHGIVIARQKSKKIYDAFFSLDPEDLLLVAVNNKVTLFDSTILDDTPEGYTLVSLGNSHKWVQSSFASIISTLVQQGVKLPLQISLA